MKGKVLFVNTKDLYTPISRRQNVMTDGHIAKIVEKFRLFERGELDKIDEVEFAKVATLEEITKNGYVLTPGRYVGVKLDLDDESFDEKMRVHDKELSKLLKEEKELKTKIKEVFDTLGYEMEV